MFLVGWQAPESRPRSAAGDLTTVSSWLFIPSPFATLHFLPPTTVHRFSSALVCQEVKEPGQWRAEAAAADVTVPAVPIGENSPARLSCQWAKRRLELWKG